MESSQTMRTCTEPTHRGISSRTFPRLEDSPWKWKCHAFLIQPLLGSRIRRCQKLWIDTSSSQGIDWNRLAFGNAECPYLIETSPCTWYSSTSILAGFSTKQNHEFQASLVSTVWLVSMCRCPSRLFVLRFFVLGGKTTSGHSFVVDDNSNHHCQGS